jgi:putative ATP-dependent endonuclease of the OLD family
MPLGARAVTRENDQMRMRELLIQNFRCLETLAMPLDDLTVLIGANGAGKSSVLRALDWFFNEGSLDLEDIYCGEIDRVISVAVLFDELDGADKDSFGPFAAGGTAWFRKSWSPEDGLEVSGKRRAYLPFEDIRALSRVDDKKKKYNEMRRNASEVNLPAASTGAAILRALEDWESDHEDQLEIVESSAESHFSSIGERFEYLFAPAVADAGDQVRDSRGALLAQLLSRLMVGGNEFDTKVRELEAEFKTKVEELMTEAHTEGLKLLSQGLSQALRQFVSDGVVSLEPREMPVKVPSRPDISMRVGDGGFTTDVLRQGHGFQRALLLATLQEIANREVQGSQPSLLLGIEEPELYQHPTQARHISTVLSNLGEDKRKRMQVLFATHSPYFVDPSKFGRLRSFGKRQIEGRPHISVRVPDRTAVSKRLSGIHDPGDIPRKIGLTLKTSLAEAVFASAVLLVEGPSDAGSIRGFAERLGIALDGRGIALISASGKNDLPLALAVLEEVGVPVFVVFDADRGQEERMRQSGADETAIESATTESVRWNRILLAMFEQTPEDWPVSVVTEHFAVFEDRLETYLEEQSPGFIALIEEARSEDGGEARDKPEWYLEAAKRSPHEVPSLINDILSKVSALA